MQGDLLHLWVELAVLNQNATLKLHFLLTSLAVRLTFRAKVLDLVLSVRI